MENNLGESTLNNIIFFDDVCVLCAKTVKFLIQSDKNKLLKYSTLQGCTIKKLNICFENQNIQSLIFYSDEKVYYKSQAVLKIMYLLGGWVRVLSVLLNLVPNFILNLIYDWVAKNRYKIFGKNENCYVPTMAEKSLFLN